MNVQEAQKQVNEYFSKSGFEKWPRFVILARLEEEISEIARIMSVEDGYREASKIDNLDYTDEFGDAFFQLLLLASECGVDAQEALKNVFSKYEKYT